MLPRTAASYVQTSITRNRNKDYFSRGMARFWTLSLTLLLAGTVNAQSECYPNQLLP